MKSVMYKGISIDIMAGYYRIVFSNGTISDHKSLHSAKLWITKHCL